MDPVANNCKKCHQAIKAASFFQCKGLCGGFFHINCTTSNQQHMRISQEVPNLFWYCDGCVEVMGTPEFHTAFMALCDAFRNLSEVNKKVVNEIKTELVETNNKVDTLVSKLPGTQAVPWPIGKRRRSNDSELTDQPEAPKSSIGRKVMKTAVPIVINQDEQEDMYWIWLSSFPPTATDEDIRSMVRECLLCDADEKIDVKMLVKKDADVSKLRAVSFKVGVDLKYQDAAEDGDNWPAGVAYREFVFYGRAEGSGFSKNRRVV